MRGNDAAHAFTAANDAPETLWGGACGVLGGRGPPFHERRFQGRKATLRGTMNWKHFDSSLLLT